MISDYVVVDLYRKFTSGTDMARENCSGTNEEVQLCLQTILAGMALVCWKSAHDIEARSKSKEIDKQLQRDKLYREREVKILLLGAGESGKSTFLKQMKIINGEKFSDEQMKEYRAIIYGNVIRGVNVLVDARDKLGIPWGNVECEQHAQLLRKLDTRQQIDPLVFTQLATSCNVIWKDRGVQHAFERRSEYQLVSLHSM